MPNIPRALQFVHFAFYRIDLDWKRLPPNEKLVGRNEFLRMAESYQDIVVLPYSLVGLRGDVDFMLWRIGSELETFQEMSSHVNSTGLGKYLLCPYSYLSMTEQNVRAGPTVSERPRYLFVLSFAKKQEWDLLPSESRQQWMDEHEKIIGRHSSVTAHHLDWSGIGEQGGMAVFGADRPQDFSVFLEEWRKSKVVSQAFQPISLFTCIARDLDDILESLG